LKVKVRKARIIRKLLQTKGKKGGITWMLLNREGRNERII